MTAPQKNAPRICVGCGVKPQAYRGRELCYDCKPGGRGRPRPCRRCGATGDYWTSGLCRRCHRYAPHRPESCRDCDAWGVARTDKWLCRGCKGWRNWNKGRTGPCIGCHRFRTINKRGACRLCWLHAKQHRGPGETAAAVDVVAANRHGQQLMLANMSSSKNGYRPHPRHNRPRPHLRLTDRVPLDVSCRLPDRTIAAGQLSLLAWAPVIDAARRRGVPHPPNEVLAEQLDELVVSHAARHSWTAAMRQHARIGMRVLLGARQITALPVRASDVRHLAAMKFSTGPILNVLHDAGLLDDDRRQRQIQAWFDHRVADLPAPMTSELGTWLDVLHNGSTTPPRSRPRAAVTVRLRLRWALPVLRGWVAAGHTSLREITREHVLEVLPAAGNPRTKIGCAFRSIFTTLKAHKVIFINPMARIEVGNFERRTPLPADPTRLRDILAAPAPPDAALAALAVFHGLRPRELRELQLIDYRDGQLQLPDRTIRLAAPVRAKLDAYLRYRRERWPNTLNPHFFVHFLSAPTLGPVKFYWVNDHLGVAARDLRQDRIVDEAISTRGDIRRICDFFGVCTGTAEHYVSVLANPSPDLDRADTDASGSRTQGPT